MLQTIVISDDENIYYQKVDYSSYNTLNNELKDKGFQLDALNSIRNEKRKAEWLGIRKIIADQLPLPEDIIYDNHNKPRFKNSSAFLSISHSMEMIAVGVNKAFPIGIDLQKITDKIIHIRHKFLTVDELSKSKENPVLLTIQWCVKEALFKLYGKKDAYLKDNMRVLSFEFNGKVGFARGCLNVGSIQDEYYFHIKKLDDYILAYSVNS